MMRFGALLILALTAPVAADPKPNPYGPARPTPPVVAPDAPARQPASVSRENPYILDAAPRRRENPYIVPPSRNNDPVIGPRLPPCNCPPVIERCPRG